MKDTRHQFILHWLQHIVKQPLVDLQPLSGDASLRLYYRVITHHQTYVLMDSQNDPSLQQFIDLQKLLSAQGINTPSILAHHADAHLLLLQDFGDKLLLSQLNSVTAPKLYDQAILTLIQIQSVPISKITGLPCFNHTFLQNQWQLFTHWFLDIHLQHSLTPDEKQLLAKCYTQLETFIQTLPRMLVHLDYHSRNLMLCENGQLGVLDFQDASIGPAAYDIASLLQDAYIRWPKAQILDWLALYHDKAIQANIDLPTQFETFLQQFHWVALQRHLKNLGIFARLYHRDHKANYLNDIPMLLSYIREICKQEEAFNALGLFFEHHIHPRFEALQRAL